MDSSNTYTPEELETVETLRSFSPEDIEAAVALLKLSREGTTPTDGGKEKTRACPPQAQSNIGQGNGCARPADLPMRASLVRTPGRNSHVYLPADIPPVRGSVKTVSQYNRNLCAAENHIIDVVLAQYGLTRRNDIHGQPPPGFQLARLKVDLETAKNNIDQALLKEANRMLAVRASLQRARRADQRARNGHTEGRQNDNSER
ncbi:hypothetical protein BU24DRAFT_466312 [Aaosphaeria arxii CBS 175.79]|uniref:Uncharacterized protein n=1 Tax=Aaosphaeria arxii CBS 175.79 TaxID=1450172 RepID=A0A6A5XFL4_9PLEO|nr:uncharacterized protein BU24DRAFT_466312 [Aaosphaeria arxii CBS 175.79]KAF2011621.1 hypothetical protein BU24DRAFT_466312 [Aaosphaeria arxii CBS 175.79]